MKKTQNYDCAQCGQDLRLPADAPQRMRALERVVKVAKKEHVPTTREIGNEEKCSACEAEAKGNATSLPHRCNGRRPPEPGEGGER